MSDEETWERRWIKAVKTIAEREEVIDILKAERDRLEANMRARPTGTRSQRESQLEKELEQTRAARDANFERAEKLEAEIEQLTQRNDTLRAQRDSAVEARFAADEWCRRAGELEAQVKRLLAKDGKRISETLTGGRHDQVEN